MAVRMKASKAVRASAEAEASSGLTSIEADDRQGVFHELQRRLLVTLLSVLFYYYPSLLSTTLNLFACYRIDRIDTGSVVYPGNARVGFY